MNDYHGVPHVARIEHITDIVAREVNQGYMVTKNRHGATGLYSPTQFALLKKAWPAASVTVL